MPDVLDGPQTEALVSEPKRMTAEEFASRHENDRVELIAGIVREKPMPHWEHGRVCVRISSRLDLFAEKEYGQVFSNDSFIRLRIPDRFGDTVYGPDVSFVSYERLPRGPLPRELSEIIPELVVEVKSPSDSWSYVFGKMGDYLRGGVSVVVILNPETQTGSVYRPNALQTTLGIDDKLTIPDIIPGFAVRVGDLFGV